MFDLTIETTFAAAHAIVMQGTREPIHGHNWHVTATIEGNELDSDGLLVDFHAVQHCLDDIVRPFVNANLNDVPPFDRVNPTAELVAKHIADSLDRSLDAERRRAGRSLRVAALRVTEAPGCAAVFRPHASI